MDLLPQYFKMVNKINHGAGFIVTQAGWDMMKLQEVRWFLNIRDLHVPTIARLMLLTRDLVERILSGEFPGIHISRDFKLILEKEARYGYQQFAAAQWRRLQLQAAGCHLMGYSGIQIYGIEIPEHISTLRAKVEESLNEFSDFQEWRDAYVAHISRSDMAPFSHRYYLYKNLFDERDAVSAIKTPESIDPPSFLEKSLHTLRKSMFSKDHLLAPDEHRLFKKIFAACAQCDYCRLPMTQYICPEICPKGLSNGPCGGGAADGTCELRDAPCVYAARTRIAAWLNEIDVLEERYVKHPEEAAKVKSV
jgi:methylenetetrahydrofolate reductase (NADPH)